MKLADIAKALNAQLENASPETEITGVAGIEQANLRSKLTFVSNPKIQRDSQDNRKLQRS